MEVSQRLDEVVSTLDKLSENISDRYNTTVDIMNALTKFVHEGLDELTREIRVIRDQAYEEEQAILEDK